MTRAFVVGLDGASWDLVDQWIEEGDLPHLERLRERGAWSTSRSCYPPVTFPNWKCYSSGKNPGQFGVYWFEHIDLDEGRIEVMNGSNFDTAEIWDYLNEADERVGVVNMPTNYPPRDIDRYVIAGGPDAVGGEYRSIDSGYTNDPDLERRLEAEYDYAVHPSPLLSSNDERGAEVDEILRLLDLRFQVALDLFQEDDLEFVHVTLFYLNVLQHFFWDEEPTKRAWKLVDEWLGRLMDLDDTNLFVMSDHGCIETEVEFYINEWLAERGYLTYERTVDDYLQSVGINRENALKVAKRLGIVSLLAATVPERIQQLVPQEAGAKRQRKLEKIVLSETQALASGQGPVYLNPAFDIDSVQERLIEDLKRVSDENGDPLFADVFRGDEVYSGEYVRSGPEVVVEARPGVTINDGMGGGEIQSEPVRWRAENSMTGIFVAAGPDVAAEGNLGETSILDIAPTVLASFGLDLPTDLDGEVLPVFESAPDVGQRDPIRGIRDGGGSASEEVANRLKELGYME
jgi:predicted AlkP superfamily phosphohydrolase/phosphomutase